MKKEKQEEAHEEKLSSEVNEPIRQLADELLELIEQNSEDKNPSSTPTAKIESINHMDLVEQALEKFKEEKTIDQGKKEIDQKIKEDLAIGQTDQTKIEIIKEKNLIDLTTDQRNPELTDEVEKANLLKMVDQALEFLEEQESDSQENNEKNNQLENSMIEEKTPVEIQKVNDSNKEFNIETETKIVKDLVEHALEKLEDQTIMPQAKEEEYQGNEKRTFTYLKDGNSTLTPQQSSNQLFNSNQVGYVYKDTKWQIETNWVDSPSISKYLQTIDKDKLKGFSTWVQIKTELEVSSLQRPVYYNTLIEPGKDIPSELIGKRVFIQNNNRFFKEGWNHSKFVLKRKSSNQVKYFQDHFMDKMDNKWLNTHPRTARRIRDAIYNQFCKKNKIFKSEDNKMVRGERKIIPDVFIEKFKLEKSENSWLKAFYEHIESLSPQDLANKMLKLKEKKPTVFNYYFSKKYQNTTPNEMKNQVHTIKIEIEHQQTRISKNMQRNPNQITRQNREQIMFLTPNSGVYTPHLFQTLKELNTGSQIRLLNALIAAKRNIKVIEDVKTYSLSKYNPTTEINKQLPESLRGMTIFVFHEPHFTRKKWSKFVSEKLFTPIRELCDVEQRRRYRYTDQKTGQRMKKKMSLHSFIKKSFNVKGRTTIFGSNYKLDTVGAATRLLLEEKKIAYSPDVRELESFFNMNPTLFKAVRQPKIQSEIKKPVIIEVHKENKYISQITTKNYHNTQMMRVLSNSESMKYQTLKETILSLVPKLQETNEARREERTDFILQWNKKMKELEQKGKKIPKEMIYSFNTRLSKKNNEVLIRRASEKYFYLEDLTEVAHDIEFNKIGEVGRNIHFNDHLNALNLIEKVFIFKRINNSYYAMMKPNCNMYLKRKVLSKSGPAKRLWDNLVLSRYRGNNVAGLVKKFGRTNNGYPAIYQLKNYSDIKDIKKVIFARYNEIIESGDYNRNIARDRHGIVANIKQEINKSQFKNHTTGNISINEFKILKVNLSRVLNEVKDQFQKPLYECDESKVFRKFIEVIIWNAKPVRLNNGNEAKISLDKIKKSNIPVAFPQKTDRKGRKVAWYEPYKVSWMNAISRYVFSNKEIREDLKLTKFKESITTVHSGHEHQRRNAVCTEPDFITYLENSKSKVGEVIQTKNIGRYSPRYPVDFFRDLVKTTGWTIDNRESCGKNAFVIKAKEASKFKAGFTRNDCHLAIIGYWGDHRGIDRIGEGAEAAREILQNFNSERVKLIMERPFNGNLSEMKIVEQIQDSWRMRKGYELVGMPPKEMIGTWKELVMITHNSKNITEFYLRILDYIANTEVKEDLNIEN